MEAFNGLAHLGTDYDINNLVSISLGPHSNRHIPVTILNNALVECDKEFYVQISGPDVGNGIRRMTVVIWDDDRSDDWSIQRLYCPQDKLLNKNVVKWMRYKKCGPKYTK